MTVRLLVGIAFGAGLLLSPLSAAEVSFTAPAPDTPEGWERESFPIGNGHFGVNVFGLVTNERLQVSHNAVVSSRPKFPWPNTTDAFEIRLRTAHADPSKYRRTLDLATGLATVSYVSDGVRYTREYFASYPDRVFVAHLTTSRPKALAFELLGEAPFPRPFGAAGPGEGPRGRTAETRLDETTIDVLQHLEYYRILFDSQLKVVTDGVCEKTTGGLRVTGASEATIVCAFGSNYRLSPRAFSAPPEKKLDPIDPREETRAILDAAARRGYAELRHRHLADFTNLMDRVALDLGDAALERYFQFGRYLLVSSSRPGTLPANLQGVWCAHDESPWGNGYWHNINVQMNYWPAFSCNLAECFEAYAGFFEAYRPATDAVCRKFLSKYVPENLPKDGETLDWWCVGTGMWPYQLGEPGGHSGPGTGGLMAKCFADWWAFTRDERILRRYVYPAERGMAEFLSRCVVETNGLFLSKFSASPEQINAPGGRWNWAKGAPPYYVTVGCAFDQQMIWETAHDFLACADHLGTNDALVARLRAQIDRYDPVQIGESGQIKEYREEKKYGEIGEYRHRHLSQLVGLFPGSLINPRRPDWMAAARYSLTERGDHSTGWALAHRICCWARLGDGDHAHKLLKTLLKEKTYPNLWDVHPPFQIDGNFGATAGIAEMLLQSQAGYVDLLPALPKAWAEKGSFRGLCARGGFEVDCAWTNGVPVRVTVRSKKGLQPDVRFRGKPFPFERDN